MHQLMPRKFVKWSSISISKQERRQRGSSRFTAHRDSLWKYNSKIWKIGCQELINFAFSRIRRSVRHKVGAKSWQMAPPMSKHTSWKSTLKNISAISAHICTKNSRALRLNSVEKWSRISITWPKRFKRLAMVRIKLNPVNTAYPTWSRQKLEWVSPVS